ncbi:glycoside hydrolase 5 family protein [Cellulomonas aerilata]|uniref:Mannan endo-1,4-beta-mannosidase n=1 Tax=Cellulomonas aerilata TaxID=515326 RepID=A0A512D921_9CELL|nr:cellulase family glycosylhydrolase [Cellulomonas aerilata]GEO32780.1 mannan endo-1,4-beta-mannosidase [Cellulomonas aerilata]
MKRPSPAVVHHGRPQHWVGVNFWSRTGGPLMWRSYDGDVVQSELETMRAHGMTVTRSFFYWPDFHPTPDTIDEGLVDRFRDFLDRHSALGMSSIPTFLVGHMSGQNWDPAWRGGRHLFRDVWFVARQAWYVRELTARLHDHPAVAGWLLTNEIPIYADWRSRGDDVLDPDEVSSWSQILLDAVRAGGGTQPVSIGEGAWGVEVTGRDNGFRVRDLAPLVDFLGPHVYRMETDQSRQLLGAAFVCELLHRSGKPVVMEEFGVTSDYTSDENGAHYYRQLLHHTLLAGATGWLAWNNTDLDHLYRQAPYTHRPFEQHFGLVDAAGVPKPQAREMRDFAALLERVDVARCSRPDSSIALVVSSWLDNQYPFTDPSDGPTIAATLRQAYVSARHADLPVVLVREADAVLWQPGTARDLADGVARGGVQYGRAVVPRDGRVELEAGQLDPAAEGPGLPDDAALYLVPSVKHLTSPTWVQLGRLARGGATVYCSYFTGTHPNQRGPWWPTMHELFGVRKLTRYGLVDAIEDDVVELRFETPFGGIPAGETLRFRTAGTEDSRAYLPVEPVGAEVVARDGRGRPALLRHRLGDGQAVLCTYPLEHMASLLPAVNPDATWRLYAALAAEAGAQPAVRVDSPDVVVGELVHEDGHTLVWLVNMTDAEARVRPVLARGTLAPLDGGPEVTTVELAAYGVQVLRLVVPDDVRRPG